MGKLIANYSGAGQIVTAPYNFGCDRQYRRLDNEFKVEILQNPRMAWYVDHYTENGDQFNVRYLSQDPRIFITNEALDQRIGAPDPCWAAEDIAEWMFDYDHGFWDYDREGKREWQKGAGTVGQPSYRYVFKFATKNSEHHKLTLEPFHGDIDGEEGEVWKRYVGLGIRGALEPFLNDFGRLVAIEVYRLG